MASVHDGTECGGSFEEMVRRGLVDAPEHAAKVTDEGIDVPEAPLAIDGVRVATIPYGKNTFEV